MSTLATLRTAVRRYINESDSANSNFTDSELTDYLNQATLFLGTQMEWPIQTDVATAAEDQALYELPDDFIEVMDIYFNDTKIPLVDRSDLAVISSTWQQADSGTPRYAYRFDESTIGLWPPPDGDQTGYDLQIQYVAMPATLTNESDIPDIQNAYQICLPFYAAFICEHKLGNDKKADVNLLNYDRHRKALMARVQKFSDDLLRFRWSV